MSSRYDEIYTHLAQLLKPMTAESATITPQARLVDDLGLDSVQVMEVMMELEDRLDTSIPLNFLPDVQTMDQLVRALEEAIGE